jgi:hypothetical protein
MTFFRKIWLGCDSLLEANTGFWLEQVQLTLHTTGDRPIQDKLFGRGMIPVLNETAM